VFAIKVYAHDQERAGLRRERPGSTKSRLAHKPGFNQKRPITYLPVEISW